MDINKKTVKKLVKISEEASAEILKVYRETNIKKKKKADRSPFTLADLKSEAVIIKGLKNISNYPIISEENYKKYNKYQTKDYWLVDPLDGTKDFLAKNGEFAINIALIRNHLPVLGLIYIPVEKDYYWAIKGEGAYKKQKRIYNRSKRKNLIGITSRFYRTHEDELFFKKNRINKVITQGSSIKFCKIAEGLVDMYPRNNGSKEWDVAAGHLILNEAGCKIINLKTKKELSYHKGSIKNDFFVALRNNLEFL